MPWRQSSYGFWESPVAECVIRGARFHYQRLGKRPEGPVAVFIHGLVMDNLSSWYFTVAGAAAARCEVLVYDLRGHGNSERTVAGYGVTEMASDLEALVDTLVPDRPLVLIGNSFGGVVALEVAARRPDQVRGLFLVDAHVGDAGLGAEMKATLELEGEARAAKIAEGFQSWVGRHSDVRRNRLAQRARELVYETQLVDELSRDSAISPDRLTKYRAPAQLLYGERSDVLERARGLEALLPQAGLTVVPGASHAVLWEATEAVKSGVLALIDAATGV